MKSYTSVAHYIASADKKTQKHLREVRATVRKAVPGAREGIAYGMPAYTWAPKTTKRVPEKPLFYFAAMKGHLGLYPTPGPIKTLTKELAAYSTSKGCVRIPYTRPVPKALVIKLLQARMKEISSFKEK
jgi:uncharacterized protein YdhG (YjbR/CyaY superfamily)